MRKSRFHVTKIQFIYSIFLLFIIKNSWADHRYDTLIIGAGVSGLTAAKQLHLAHQDVLIIEAKNRLGGRVYTNYDWGFPIELGASWIHGIDHNPLVPLLGKQSVAKTSYNNSNLIAMLRDFALYDSRGKPVSEHDLNLFSSLTHEFLQYCHTRNKLISFEQNFIEFAQQKKLTLKQSSLLYYALDNIYTYEFAENLPHLSLNSYFVSEKSIVSGKNAIVPEGYFQIFQQFSQHIPITLNQIVREIDYDTDGVTIITQNDTYHANQVIITVSLGVLKSNKILFHPRLPKEKRDAIAQLKMGNYEKLYLLFDKVFWDKDKEWIGMLPNNKEEAYNIFNLYKYTQKPILIVFTSGKLARDMEKVQLSKWVMQHLRQIYGNDIPEPIKTKKTHWVSDPYTLGSYSYLPKNIDKKVLATLAKPVAGKLYFAGEATSTTDPSTVHGAYLSGIRVAHEVLTHVKKSKNDAMSKN
ncbi:amine oxidase [Legionella gratiana]|uniref:Tryptophan 2-monooxygenase n=1 Tax=Legionella gratiana TaxID=45066 RepID=A0A378JC97_9GAMM|nr:FAD-dependent oxidoreductase [Legionella gratiana]KTD09243.1 amine oxidase [Legionella gratiana]STX45504.1 amine oxidase [Legionella gratiana]